MANIRKLKVVLFIAALLSVWSLAQSQADEFPKWPVESGDFSTFSTSPVPFEDGNCIGSLILPDNPTLAEQFACYELQRYIFKMTGLIPGLKGRDKSYDGRVIYIGRAADQEQLKKLKGLPDDSYIIRSQENKITLAGKTDESTLYAIYDFLSQQGIRWVIPGDLGEIVPQRKTLIACKSRVESPDYDCRGFMVMGQDFFPGGGEERGWAPINMDDYFDWFLRNRLNAIWLAEDKSYDFGAHRGHGWVQILGHSYGGTIAPHQKYFKDHPEWYALVNGKRVPVCTLPPMFVNQLCVSNKGLRDYTVNLVLDYFKNNPQTRAFPLSPMDGPSFWCECEDCKKLDPPGLDWSKNSTEGNISGMTDRALNYANEVAERVSKVYPDKFIEMYAYGYTRQSPVKEKVHKNVFIKYANMLPGPLGRSILDKDETLKISEAYWDEPKNVWKEWREQLQGWKDAGATLAWYNYLEWDHPDVTLFWFYNTTDVLKTLNRQYNCKILLGETENNIMVSTMLYNVLARTVWDVNTDYKEVIRDVCNKFYGPVADEMYNYNMLMDGEILKSTAWKEKGWHPHQHLDISLSALEQGQKMLEDAAAKVEDDNNLAKRVAYARFGHAYLTYVHTLNEKVKTKETERIARLAFDRANSLRSKYNIMIKLPSVRQLKTFYYPPIIDEESVVIELPDLWDFKKDPTDTGIRDKWFEKGVDDSWVKISTSRDWTSQAPGSGYHGVAWYHVSFDFPTNVKINAGSGLYLYFGAVDGLVDVCLDGVKIGEQKESVGAMWDKPFSLPLPSDIDLKSTHHLMVRVAKDDAAAGIWKQVRIMAMDVSKEKDKPASTQQGRTNW